jgi:flagellar protein FliS
VIRRLLYANLHNDASVLDEVDALLDSLASAWREIEPGRGGF